VLRKLGGLQVLIFPYGKRDRAERLMEGGLMDA
jgi:hypothetical protein